MIVTGVAAQIIDFSRHPDVQGNIYGEEGFRHVDSMSAVFAKMALAVETVIIFSLLVSF